MSNDKAEERPLFPQEVCDDLLFSCSVNAFRAHKSVNKAVYNAEIDTIAKLCASLLTHYHQTPQSIIAHMETAMAEAHNNELKEIDCQIKHLFQIRKQAPAHTSYGEQEIIKLTTKINALEELKAMPVKDTIEGIVCTSFEKAVSVIGAEIPANFNLSQYEYIPIGSK